MKLLGDLLIGAKAISVDQREKALLQAKREKVRLGTALLDLGFVSEEILLRALSVQRQVPSAPAADLRQIRTDILRLVPSKLASKLRVIPFRRVGRQVSLAMRDPSDLPAIDEISFLTGLPISPHVALEVRIELALFAHYEIDVTERFHRLSKRLDAVGGAAPEAGPTTELRRTPSGSFAAVLVPAPAPAPPPGPVMPPPPQFGGSREKTHSGVFPMLQGDPWGSSDAFERAKVYDAVETYEESVAGPSPVAVPSAPAASQPLPTAVSAPPAPAPVMIPPPPAPPVAAAPAAATTAPSAPAAPLAVAAPPAPARGSSVAEIDDEDVRLLRGDSQITSVVAVQSEIHAAETTGEIAPIPHEEPQPASFDLVASLSSAETRDEVAEAVLQAASEQVRRAALFIVQSDRVIGWAARPEPPEGLRSLSIPFSEPSVFASIRNTEGFYVGPCPDLPANRRSLQALGVLGLASIAVVPVTLKGKSVLFLLGEFDSGSPAPSVASLKRLASMTATALEILLLKNRLRQA